MPSKLHKVELPEELAETLAADAGSKKYRRTVEDHILWILEGYYAARREEAELFTRNQLRAKPQDVPVFRTPDPPEPAPLSRIRESMGREENE